MKNIKQLLLIIIPIVLFFLAVSIAYYKYRGPDFSLHSANGGHVNLRLYDDKLIVLCPYNTHILMYYDTKFIKDIGNLSLTDYHNFKNVNTYHLEIDESFIGIEKEYYDKTIIWVDTDNDIYCGSPFFSKMPYNNVYVTKEGKEYFAATKDFIEFYVFDEFSMVEKSLNNNERPRRREILLLNFNYVKKFDAELGKKMHERYDYLQERYLKYLENNKK